MSRFLLNQEIDYLQEIKKRDFEFEDGEILRISMYQLFWNWYDRFCAKDKDFHNRTILMIRQEAALRGIDCGETLQQVLEEIVRRRFNRGENPFETIEERMQRQSLMWKLLGKTKKSKAPPSKYPGT